VSFLGKAVLFGGLTSSDIKRIVKSKKKPVVILPLGATEAHGEHLPVFTDSITPYEIAKKISEKTGALVLPPINYGFCYTLRPWAGTISLKSSTFAMIIKDITAELLRNGFERILFLNGHGGNAAVVNQVLKELQDEICGPPVPFKKENKKCNFRAALVSWWEIKELRSVCGDSIGHADENEESMLLAIYDWKKRKAVQALNSFYFGRVFPMPSDQFTSYGYMGKVKNSSKEKGEKMLNIVVDKLVKLINADLLLKE
jgi:creatinine amidohydrolase